MLATGELTELYMLDEKIQPEEVTVLFVSYQYQSNFFSLMNDVCVSIEYYY